MIIILDRNNELVGFNNIDSHFPFMGGIDITPDYEFMGIMDPPPAYQIVKVHDSNMIEVTTRTSRGNDRAHPSPLGK